MSVDYYDFLAAKSPVPVERGHVVDVGEINPILFPHQSAIVEWAVRLGRAAIFAAFGLGKCVMQIETLRLVTPEGERALIVCPLGVRAEFRHDAEMLGVPVTFVRRTEDIGGPGIYITNYEPVRDGKLDVNQFAAVSLDEASVLRSFGSKTYISFLELFDAVPYRFVATATPSPNRYKELIHYAGFLGVMDTGQALTRFFQRDSTKANNLTLYPHKEAEFWLWLSSWAVFLQTPADLGYPAEGYALPELEVHYHKVLTDPNRSISWEGDGQGRLVNTGNIGVSQAAAEKRDTIEDRLGEVMDILADHDIGDGAEGRLPATFMALQPASWHPDVWHDINRMLTLNTEQSRKAQAMHVCPLQFDIVDRLIGRYSNPGELVYDPFGGLFTVPYRAILSGRRGRAAELNPGYFLDGIKYLQAAERKKGMPTLFDLDEVPAEVGA